MKLIKYLLFSLLSIFLFFPATAQTPTDPELNGMRAIGSPANPKVKWSWNYYMDFRSKNRKCGSQTGVLD